MTDWSPQEILHWVTAHPGWTGLIVFLVAFLESMAIVGVLVPGAMFMIAFGAAITTGYMSFWPTMWLAVAGAIAGDFLSYWLGYHYKQQLTRIWPLSRRPQLLTHGMQFFEKHGGKSVILGRFVGPLRASVPAAAGMFRMPFHKFAIANVISALGWSPLYLLPGLILGASFELASEVAGRLAVLFMGTLITLYLLVKIFQFFYARTLPRVDRIVARLVNWSKRHPLLGEVPTALIDPNQPETRVLSLFALLLLIATLSLVILMHLLLQTVEPDSFSQLVNYQLEGLHTPIGNVLMSELNHLTNPTLLSTFVLVFSLWLGLNQRWKAVSHLVAALVLPYLTLMLLRLAFEHAISTEHPFPVSDIAVAYSVYGFTGILLAGEISSRFRSLIYALALVLVSMVAFARLYLGVDWFAFVVSGSLLSMAWIAALGIGFRRHTLQAQHKARHLPVAGFILLLSMIVIPKQANNLPAAEAKDVTIATLSAWRLNNWQSLPAFRNDLREKQNHPFNLQWVGEKETIIAVLREHGWKHSNPVDFKKISQWLNPSPSAIQLPIFPQVHSGLYEDIRMIKPDDPSRIRVVRLWLARQKISSTRGIKPLWVGNVSFLTSTRQAGFSFLKTANTFDEAMKKTKAEFTSIKETIVQKNDRRVLLVETL